MISYILERFNPLNFKDSNPVILKQKRRRALNRVLFRVFLGKKFVSNSLINKAFDSLGNDPSEYGTIRARYLLGEVHDVFRDSRGGIANKKMFKSLGEELCEKMFRLHKVLLTRELHQGITYSCMTTIHVDLKDRQLTLLSPIHIQEKGDNLIIRSVDYELETTPEFLETKRESLVLREVKTMLQEINSAL